MFSSKGNHESHTHTYTIHTLISRWNLKNQSSLHQTYYWIDLLEGKHDLHTHVDHNQLDPIHHLKSYTSILWICGDTGTSWFLNQHNIWCVYIYGKGLSNWLWSTWGQVLFPFSINRSIQYSSLLLSKTIFLLFQVCFWCFCILVECLEAYIKCEQSSGGSPRLLSPFLILLPYTTHINAMYCFEWTHVHHIDHYKINTIIL